MGLYREILNNNFVEESKIVNELEKIKNPEIISDIKDWSNDPWRNLYKDDNTIKQITSKYTYNDIMSTDSREIMRSCFGIKTWCFLGIYLKNPKFTFGYKNKMITYLCDVSCEDCLKKLFENRIELFNK